MHTTIITCVFFSLSSLMDEATCLQGLRQDIFIKEEFHYLNVPKVGTYTVHDVFDCTFECLSNPSCLSFNMAAAAGADGKLWCELLSADKFSIPKDYKGNQSSHHFFTEFQNPCESSPCQNGGTCLISHKYPTIDCKCKQGFIGEYCEMLAGNSCKYLYEANQSNVSQLVNLTLDSKPTSVLCQLGDFGCGAGGWTPVMKIDGYKQTFRYDASWWSNKLSFNLTGGETGFDTAETKLPTYWNTPFSKICLGMKHLGKINFVVISKQAKSLHSLIADRKYRATSLGRIKWKTLIGSVYLQSNCNREGFNAQCTQYHSARIGIMGNDQNDCNTCNSYIGFGIKGGHSNTTCGDRYKKVMGYVLVE